jgi:hypothetical protein
VEDAAARVRAEPLERLVGGVAGIAGLGGLVGDAAGLARSVEKRIFPSLPKIRTFSIPSSAPSVSMMR